MLTLLQGDYKVQKKSFIKSATLMMMATMVAKVIGACYRIPLTNILGAEGMGIYQLIFPVYSLILTTSSGALPLAISVLVSERIASQEYGRARRLVKTALSGLLITGTALTLILMLTGGFISSLQGSSKATYGYIAIAPSILFVSGIAVMKGWFQGNANMVPTALSQISEAIVKLAVGLTLAYFLMPYGVEYAVSGALIGVSASEGITFLMLLLIYKRKNPPIDLGFNIGGARREYIEIIKISLPITIGSMIFPLTQFIDSFMVVNILTLNVGVGNATALYGLFSGPVSTLINLPVALSLAIGVAVVPHLSKNKEERDLKAIRLKTTTAIKSAVLIGVPFAVLYLIAPYQILKLLYGGLSERELLQATNLLRISAPTVILLAVMQICTSVLQGLKNTRAPIINLLIGGAVKTASGVALLFTAGIEGVAIASLIAFTVVCLLNALSLSKLMGKNGDVVKNSGVIILLGGIIAICLTVAVHLTDSPIWILFTAVIGGLAYLIAVFLSRAFGKEEIISLPFGSAIVKLKK